MIAMTGTFGILAAYLICGYMGYCIGVQRGIDKCKTKRFERR